MYSYLTSPGPLGELVDLLLVHGQLRGPRRPVPRDPVHRVVLQLPPAAAHAPTLRRSSIGGAPLLLLLRALLSLGLGGERVDHPELLLVLLVAEIEVVDVAPGVGPLHREFLNLHLKLKFFAFTALNQNKPLHERQKSNIKSPRE